MRLRITSGLFLALLTSAGLVNGQTAVDGGTDTTIQNAVQDVMQRHDIPGMAIAITHKGEERFYNFGIASRQTGQPVTADTLFELGSISKTFTATLATWAQARQQLSLTDRIDSYLPQLRDTRLGKLPVFHLATHTAGGFPLQVPEQIQTRQQLMAYFKAWQPEYLAGTHRSYANPSIGLLGVVAARSMDMPFEQAMEQQLFPALGLTHTYLSVPSDKFAAYAQGYDKRNAPVRLNPGVLAAEAYGVKSSSRDLLHYLKAQLGASASNTPLNRALLDTRVGYFKVGSMTQDLVWEQYEQPVRLDTLLQGNSSDMGLKTQRAQALNPSLPPQQNAWINKTGSTNGFGGYVAFIPDKQLGLVVLANRSYPNEERVKLAYRILSELGCCSAD